MIDIVIFDRPLIGYKQNNAVVYASVPHELSDVDAKQYGYEQVKSALEYERTRDSPSIDGSEMGAIETFIPELPKVKALKLIGDTYVQFEEDETERTLAFTIEATDQYGDPIERDWEWTGAVDGVLTVTPIDEGLTVTVSADGVTASIDVSVYPYVEPVHEKTIEEKLNELSVNLGNTQAQSFNTDTALMEFMDYYFENGGM
ncbi:hypothetical protein MKY15_20545 [Sporosarcina sp. FSL K6-1540]|uniref:hypothetical protein n=1 Tax=Sporosarcina sp. FSL K6-1540 TaxID=2921555 RepID=UPI00315A813B